MNKFYVCIVSLAAVLLIGCEDEPEPVPAPPSSLLASVVSTTQIDLTWADNSTNESGFKIQRREGSGEFVIVGTAGKDVNAYSDQGLAERTVYTYRVFAVSASHETGEYSNEASATTQGTPVLSTSGISAITAFAAISGGTITNDGGSAITAKGVVWSTSANPTIALSTKTSDGAGAGSFVSSLAGLNWDTEYHVRAYATNAVGTAYGEDISFTTGPLVISTTAASNITPFAASSGGVIDGEGGTSIIARGIVWSTSANPTIALSTKTSDGAGAGSFVSSLTGLNWETEYHVRAYATNSTGTTYGDGVVFTTAPIDITTAAVIEVTHKAATSGGTIGGDGGTSITARGIVWGTSPNPTVALSTKTQNGTGTGNFTSSITNLTPNITYYIRSYASNNATTSYGSEASFVTDHEITDIEGNIYPIVQIGTQIWMAVNLKTTKYNDGTSIPEITNNIEWGSLTTPGFGWYNNDKMTYSDPYGALYNWYAANSTKLCPTGWHVPSDEEWTVLTNNLGGLSVAGGKLKETGTAHWDIPNTGATNESGFSVPGSGYRTLDGTSVLIRREGNFWTSTALNSDNGWYRFMGNETGSVIRGAPDKNYGSAIRCLSD